MALSTRSQVAVAGLVIVVVVAGLSLGFEFLHSRPSTTPGHWPAEQKAAFIESCNTKCKAAPGVTPDRYPLCEKVCTCSADEGEKILSDADLSEIYAAQQSGKMSLEQNEKMQKLTKVAQACTASTTKP